MIKITINTNNAAFEGENKGYEVARILRELADKAEEGYAEIYIRDINGNRVGIYQDSDNI